MRIVKLVIFSLVLTTLSTLNAQAQACGGAFNTVKISDSEGKSIRGAIIELVAQLPREEYEKVRLNKVIKTSAQDAEAILKQNLTIDRTKDFICGNPLKQRANITRVKTLNGEPSIENFGFCTMETYTTPFLLKVSAPNYVTDYYLGNYFGGCGNIYEFVLTKKRNVGRRKKSV